MQKHAKDQRPECSDYLKAVPGPVTRYLEGVDLQALVLYERSVRFLDVVIKIRDIAEVA